MHDLLVSAVPIFAKIDIVRTTSCSTGLSCHYLLEELRYFKMFKGKNANTFRLGSINRKPSFLFAKNVHLDYYYYIIIILLLLVVVVVVVI